jgi:hypothetical protein
MPAKEMCAVDVNRVWVHIDAELLVWRAFRERTRGCVRFAAGSVEVHNDGLRLLRELLRAGDDVLLGVGIEIPLIKRTGVQRIEELR